MVDFVVESAIAGVGLACLGLAFHRRGTRLALLAIPGWALLGLFFFTGTDDYIELQDPMLIILTGAALPAGLAVGVWEFVSWKHERSEPALVWLRGAVFWAGLPYLAIERVPYANAAAVWFIAWQTVLFLRMSGVDGGTRGEIAMGEMQVDPAGSLTSVPWSSWEGNRWLLTEPLSEHGIYLPLEYSNGDPVLINFVLACTALQSMIVFVGAIAALRAPWRRSMRALLVAIPTIHMLNVFRNAGIIWLQQRYASSFRLWGLDMFDFSHSYVAKAGSLFAMFLMALVLFELLPELHSHVLRLLEPPLRLLGIRLPEVGPVPAEPTEGADLDGDPQPLDLIETTEAGHTPR